MSKGLPRSSARANPQVAAVLKKRFIVKNLAMTITNGSSAAGAGTAVVGALPQGNIALLGAIAMLQFDATGDTDATATWNGDYGVGTVPNANATLSGTDVDVVASAAVGPAVARVSPVTRGASGAPAALFDNTDGSLELNLNVLADDADQSGDISLTVNGFIDIVFAVLGDD